MKAKRRRHDNAFKARVALEAMKEEKTIHQIAKENDVHPTQVTEWKKMLAENIAGHGVEPHLNSKTRQKSVRR